MLDFFLKTYKNASMMQILLESVAFIFGIASVWYAKKQNILVYPTGIVATVITSFLLFQAGYLGDMCINAYFTIMSFYGWLLWSRKNVENDFLPITTTTSKEKKIGILLFIITIFVVLAIYKIFNYRLKADNYVDVFTSGLFFTAMWYMARKKLENWTLWIVGDIIVVPLYAYRGMGILALQYFIFTILAILAYIEWKKNLDSTKPMI